MLRPHRLTASRQACLDPRRILWEREAVGDPATIATRPGEGSAGDVRFDALLEAQRRVLLAREGLRQTKNRLRETEAAMVGREDGDLSAFEARIEHFHRQGQAGEERLAALLSLPGAAGSELVDLERNLAGALRSGDPARFTKAVVELADRHPLHLESVLIPHLKSAAREDAALVFDALLAVDTIDRLKLVALGVTAAVRNERLEAALGWLRALVKVRAGMMRFGPADRLGASLSPRANDPNVRGLLLQLKYGEDAPARKRSLRAVAESAAARLDVDIDVAWEIYAMRDDRECAFEPWLQAFKTSLCIEHVANDRPRPRQFTSHDLNTPYRVDTSELEGLLSGRENGQGRMLLTWHAGLRVVALKTLQTMLPGSLTVQSLEGDPDKVIAVGQDGAAGLLRVVKELRRRKDIILYLDAKRGIRANFGAVGGRSVPHSLGPALAAYRTRCDTVWFTVLPEADGLKLEARLLPKPDVGEPFEIFAERWGRSYWAQVDRIVRGSPENLALGAFWTRPDQWEM